MRVLLVDDEPLALRRLMFSLREVPNVEIVGTANDGDAALGQIKLLKPDLVILDVEMPGLDGLEVAQKIGMTETEVVFCTAFERYAFEAFSVEATDYLLKPVKPARLRQAINRAERRIAERQAARDLAARIANRPGIEAGAGSPRGPEQPAILHLPDRHGGRDLPQSEIIWIESAKDYALIRTRTRSYIIRTTMAALAPQLIPSIVRVHRSAFVAVACVKRRLPTEKGVFSLILDDEAEIPVGPTYLLQVRRILRTLRPELD
jgi:DNA-binding LytR/AlgR family response regulator